MAAPGAMTQEEFYRMMLEAQLGKGNLAAQGKEADRQDLYAQQLRQGAGKGMDVAGNLSRALAGAGAGWQEREAAKARKGIASKEEAFFNEWKDRLGAKAAPSGGYGPPDDYPAAPPQMPPPPMGPQGGDPGGMIAPPPQDTGMGMMAPPAAPPGPPPGPQMSPNPMMGQMPPPDMAAGMPPQPPAAPEAPMPPGPQATPNPTVTPDASDLFQMLLKKKKDEEMDLMGMF